MLCTIVCGMFYCWTADVVGLHGLWMKATWTWSTSASVIGHQTIYFTYKFNFLLVIPLQTLYEITLHCINRPRLMKPQHQFTFFYLRHHVSIMLGMEIFGNSCATNDELDNISFSNAFWLLSCAFQFISNVTVKWYTFHVYTLYILSTVISRYI
jgi:hypothetical protein